MEKKARYIYLDALRILCCLCVIYMHVNERGQFMFAYRELGSALYFIELFISISTKLAVPVFFAISGALLLHREILLRKLWFGKIAKTGVVLVLFSLLSYAATIRQGYAQWGLKTFVFGVYDSSWNIAYWYLYAYLAFLMVSPVLGSLVRGMNRRDALYFIALAFAFRCFLPGLEQLRWEGVHRLNSDLSLTCITCDIVLYPCLGYYMHHRLSQEQCRRYAPALFAAAALFTMLACYMTWRESSKIWTLFIQKYHELFAPVLCVAAFVCAKAWLCGVKAESRTGKAIRLLAGCTFGVYLVHLPALQMLAPLFDHVWNALLALCLPRALAGMLYCTAVFAVCAVPVWLLKKIPGFGRLLS